MEGAGFEGGIVGRGRGEAGRGDEGEREEGGEEQVFHGVCFCFRASAGRGDSAVEGLEDVGGWREKTPRGGRKVRARHSADFVLLLCSLISFILAAPPPPGQAFAGGGAREE